jgi:sortase A
MTYRARRFAFFAALTLAMSFGISAAWIPVKAQVAQVLLHRAWDRARNGTADAKPWPWADTWPVGRLRAPQYGIDEIVLAGASGSSLAFAPGHIDGTALPGRCGNCVLSGHRDTHFRFLARLQPGDRLELEAPDGTLQRFVVRSTSVLYRNDVHVLDDSTEPVLTLVTCYPFDAVVPGGPLRFVVRAEPVEV